MTRPDGRRVDGVAVRERVPAVGSFRMRPAWRWFLWPIRIATAAGLAVDAYVHFDLAPLYAEAGGVINESVLFRAEAVVALLTAAAVLVFGRRVWYLAALVVAASALAVMLVARYVDLGPIGPLPNLHDPVWFPEKLLAAFAEGAASVAALAGAVITGITCKAGKTRSKAGLPQP